MTDREEPIAAAALDSNFAELIRWYASRPGGEIVEGADVTLCSTGLAFRSINGAVDIDLAPATADQRIDEIGHWFGERGLPWRWLVGRHARTSVGLSDRDAVTGGESPPEIGQAWQGPPTFPGRAAGS